VWLTTLRRADGTRRLGAPSCKFVRRARRGADGFFMPEYIVPALTFLLGFVLAMRTSQRVNDKATQLQRDIVKRGQAAHARVVRIWQPPLMGSFARIYFEFEPEGLGRVIRGCHIDRRVSAMKSSLPAPGATVVVHYLPEDPAQAVIAKLVSRFAF
jgi:hypothetical protein